MARLHGLPAKPAEQWRVLELGCAVGSNLLPMAASLPAASFVGVDLGAEHVRLGQELARDAELGNVQLHHASIADITPDWGLFDAILCHGVFSWVPATVQHHILRVAKENLAPTGVALISYNALPGWYDRLPAREFMRRLAGDGPPRQRVLNARNALARLAMSVPKDDPQHEVLSRLDKSLTGMSDAYILHEYLSPENTPLHFDRFLSLAEEHGLSWLCEAAPLWGHTFDEHGQHLLDVPSAKEWEARMDFMRNRMFRTTMLAHPEFENDTRPHWTRLREGFQISASFALKDGRVGDEDEDAWLDVPEDLLSPLQHLVKNHRRLWGLDELAATAKVDVDALGPLLMRIYRYGLLELRDRPRRCQVSIQATPEVCRYARAQAQRGESRVASRAHLPVELEDLEVVLLPLIDGTRPIDELETAVLHIMSRGTYDPDWPGELLVSDKLRESVHDMLATLLARLLNQGLLV